MKRKIEAVLFDLDGVIVDTAVYHYHAWKRLADCLQIEFDETVNERLKGVSRMESLQMILEKSSRRYDEEEKQKMAEEKNGWYQELLNQLTPDHILPGIQDFISEIRKEGINTSICSASKNTDMILEKLGIRHLFDTVVTGHDTAKTKPDPQVFTIAAQRLGIPYENCVVIEDSAAGIQAAKACGMRSVGIGSKQLLGAADRVIDSTKKLTPSYLYTLEKRPHIIIFNPDQCRADAIHCLGNRASVTPNFDRLAEEDGICFSHAFAQNPVCTPSRCSFMTGLYPHDTGHRTIHSMVQSHEKTLLQSLKEDGYLVWWGGKNDLISAERDFHEVCDVKHESPKPITDYIHKDQSWRGPQDQDNFYSFYLGEIPPCDEKRYNDKDWAHVEGAIDFISTYEGDKPLCMYLSLGFPHPPYRVEEPFFSSIDRKNLESRIPIPENREKEPIMLDGIRKVQGLYNWTEERWNELRAVYLGMVSRIDYQFGMLTDALKKKGIYDDSMIFVFSDHGDFTGDYGLVEKNQNTFQDCLTNVPFMVKPPKWMEIQPGINDSLVELIDFYATVQDVTGFEHPHFQFGKSLLPVLRGAGGQREFVFCEGGRLMSEQHTRESESKINAVPTGLYWPRLSLQIGDGAEHGKASMFRTCDFKYVRRLYEKDELYDLTKDPNEVYNVIDEPKYKEIVCSFKEKALDFYMETGDIVKLKPDHRQ